MKQLRWSVHTSLAAITTGILASVCCIGPLLLAVLGIGGAGLLVKFEPYRPYFMGFTFLLLGAGFYFAYFRKPAVAEGDVDDCGCEQPKQKLMGKIMLWFATIIAVVAMASPYLLAAFTSGSFSRANASQHKNSRIKQVTLRIKGMTCGGCVGNVKNALKKVSGIVSFKVTYKPQQAIVRYHPNKTNVSQLVKAIRKIGYQVLGSTKSRKSAQLFPAETHLKNVFNKDIKYTRLLFMFSPV